MSRFNNNINNLKVKEVKDFFNLIAVPSNAYNEKEQNVVTSVFAKMLYSFNFKESFSRFLVASRVKPIFAKCNSQTVLEKAKNENFIIPGIFCDKSYSKIPVSNLLNEAKKQQFKIAINVLSAAGLLVSGGFFIYGILALSNIALIANTVAFVSLSTMNYLTRSLVENNDADVELKEANLLDRKAELRRAEARERRRRNQSTSNNFKESSENPRVKGSSISTKVIRRAMVVEDSDSE